MKTIITWTTVFVTLTALAFAGVPQTINYQGYLKNTDGTPVSTPTSVRFSLYSSSPARNNPIWQETRSVTPANGVYSVQLGSTTPISAPFDVPYFLGIKVGGDAEMDLQPLSSTAYAMRAALAETVPDGAITDIKISGPLSASKIPDLAGLQASMLSVQNTMTALQTQVTQQQTTITQQQREIETLVNQVVFLNHAPTANAGADQQVTAGTLVNLNGTSTDIDTNQIVTYAWSFLSKPFGSTAQFTSPATPATDFTADLAGTYRVKFSASDGVVTITDSMFLIVTPPSNAKLIDSVNSSGALSVPQVSMNASGKAVAVWYKWDGTNYNLWANLYLTNSGWGTAQLIKSGVNGDESPSVAIDPTGNAVVVWSQDNGTTLSNIWASRYTATIGWGTAVKFESMGITYSAKVSMDANGNAMAVWSEFDYTSYTFSIKAKSYIKGIGWGTVQQIQTDIYGAGDKPQIAMAGNGNAVAVWEDCAGEYCAIFANRFTVASGWGTEQLLDTNYSTALAPQVAMDPNGNAVVVWQQSDGFRYDIWANRYNSGTGWGGAQLIGETDNSLSAGSPQVVMDASGNAVAVWIQSSNTWFNRYTTGVGWGTAQLIDTTIPGNSTVPQVAINESGNAVAVWQRLHGSRYNIWANRYTAGAGWGVAYLVETDNVGNAQYPQVALGGSGNYSVLWLETDTATVTQKIWASADMQWKSAQLIESDTTWSAIGPQVAEDPLGNAIAVWMQSDANFVYNIWVNSYTSAGGWGKPKMVGFDGSGHQVTMDSNGNGIVVWNQKADKLSSIWAIRYSAGSGWGVTELIEKDDTGNALSPQISMDTSGNVIAVWYQSDGVHNNIWANRYTFDVGWGSAQLIETDKESALYPQVVLDAGGNAIAVWHQSDGTRNNIWSNLYTAGKGWGAAQLIETDNKGAAEYPQIAIEGGGKAVAVWQQSDGIRTNIWSNRYTPGTGWGTAQVIETDNAGNALSPQLAMDGSGNAVAVWYQSDGILNNIWSNRLNMGVGWESAQLLETNSAGNAQSPRVAMNAVGTAIVVWQQSDGTHDNILSKRYTPLEGWGQNQLIETNNSGGASSPKVAINGSGIATAVWSQIEGSLSHVWANRLE